MKPKPKNEKPKQGDVHMLKDKKALEQYLDKQCDRIVVNNEKCKMIYTYANEIYDIPKGIISDLITKRMLMSEASEFVLFILLDSICNVLRDDKDIQGVDKFYTMKETKFYRNSKYETEKIKFPLVFKMVQVADDQWVGCISVKTLMLLRNAQLISYNANTQRVLQKIVKGDKETYKIFLNQKAVNEIKESFEKESFISNTITLNLPLDSGSDFYYDRDKCEFVINSLDAFDILDGWHRLIAMSQVWNINENFDHPMELRITNFDEAKAKTFIWQDNKKTFMKKIDYESYNLNNEANIIVERLNNNVLCNLKGLINRNESLVDFGEMAKLVDWFYIKNNKQKGNKNALQLQAVRELTENINILTESNTKYLDEKWDYLLLLSVMCVFDYYNTEQKNKKDMCPVVEKVYSIISKSEDKVFRNRQPRKILINTVMEIIHNID